MFTYDSFQCAMVIFIIFVIGEFVSSKTKAFVPSLFVQAVLFMVGFWTKLIPTDIVASSGFTSIGVLAMLMIVVDMGTTINFKELLENWKVVVISLVSIAGMAVLLMTVGRFFFEYNSVIVSIPPLAGGATASLIMQQATSAIGRSDLTVLAATVLVTQGFVGYPLATVFLKREGQRLLKSRQIGAGSAEAQTVSNSRQEEKVSRRKTLADKPRSTYLSLLELTAIVWLSVRLESVTGLSRYVFCLVFGVVFHELGIVEKSPLTNANSFGLCVSASMAMVMMGLADSTPSLLLSMLPTLLGIFLIGIAGMLLFGTLVGKILHYSLPMSCGIALNCLFGFPPNMIITTDAVNSTSNDEADRAYLMDQMLPKMMIGGFVSVTITSTLLAGLMTSMIK